MLVMARTMSNNGYGSVHLRRLSLPHSPVLAEGDGV
jgi:hypothetical protein